MRILRIAAAASLVVLLALTGTAEAARGRVPTHHNNSDGGIVASPLTINPYPLSCAPNGKRYQGQPMIQVTNTGDKTIPAGSLVTIKWPDGTTATVKLPLDMAPGSWFSTPLPNGMVYTKPFHCTAIAVVS